MNTFSIVETPLGELTIQANDNCLIGAWFETQSTMPKHLGNHSNQHPVLRKTELQLIEYFSGKRKSFSINTEPKGTLFQRQVWKALTQIPFGKTYSYSDIANRIANPKAVRAVGLANSKNPISIIIPCHRVIGKNGRLTGYAGGVKRKEKLLNHENICT